MAPLAQNLRQSTLNFSKPQTSGRKRKASPSAEELEPSEKQLAPSTKLSLSGRGIKVVEETGDLFAAPPNAIVIHACNCQGEWGAGVAKAFKMNYPKAFANHKDYCQPYRANRNTRDLLGTAQLIEPLDGDEKHHFVGCLFTSDRFGRAKDSPKQILEATQKSIEALFRLINDWNTKNKAEEQITSMYICKINSGAFKVPWEKTRRIIENMEDDLVGIPREINVLTPEGM